MSTELLWLSEASKAIAKVSTIGEAKVLADKAATIKLYAAKQGWSVEQKAKIAEIEIRATVRLGELLRETEKASAGRPKKIGSPREPISNGTKLSDLGVTKKQSHVAQLAASVPPAKLEQYVAQRGKNGLSISGVVRLAKAEQKREAMMATAPAFPYLRYARIVTGDCLDELSKLKPESVNLAFADPPYNIGVNYGDGERSDRLEPHVYHDWCLEWMKAVAVTLHPYGSFWVLINDENAAEFKVSLRAAGMHVRQWLVWYETFGVNNPGGFNRTHRHLFWAVKNAKRFTFNAAPVTRPSDRQTKYNDARANETGKTWDSVWGVNPAIPRLVGTAAERIPDFPTQLPLALLEPIVLCASNPGEMVLDPFCGSGTTGEAAVKHRREFLGIEKQERFATLARARLGSIKG